MPHTLGQCAGWQPGIYTREQCRSCWVTKNAPTCRTPALLAPVDPPARNHLPDAGNMVRPPCIYLGDVLKRCSRGDTHVCTFEGHDFTRCTPSPNIPDLETRSCVNCRHWDDGKPHPRAGVVIGSYNLPRLIALQVKLIRHHCGDVPILIVDDCSDGYGHTPGPNTVIGQLRRIAATEKNVVLFSHPTRFGHASGDLSKVWTGIQWAAARDLEYVATISQRFLIDVPRWLQAGAVELRRSGLATGSRACVEGPGQFPIRSEAMMLEVGRWNRPDVLDHLMPRSLSPKAGEWGIAAEHVFWDDIKNKLDGRFHPWSLFGTARGKQYPGIVWHCSHGPQKYRELAARHGITLDPHFSTDGWRRLEKADYRG